MYEGAAERLRTALGPRTYEHLATEGRTMPDDAILADFRTILDAASGRRGQPLAR